MLEPRRLINLPASTTCYSDSFATENTYAEPDTSIVHPEHYSFEIYFNIILESTSSFS
jgi:hypothetical protein